MGHSLPEQKIIVERMQHIAAESVLMDSGTTPKSSRHETYRRRLRKKPLFLLLILSGIATSSAFQSTNPATSSQIQTANRIGLAHSSSQTALCIFPGFNNNDNNKDGDESKNNNDNDWNPNNIFESFKNLFGNNKNTDSTRNTNNRGIGSSSNQRPIFSQFFQPPGLSSEDYYDELGNHYETMDEDGDEYDDSYDDELPAGTSLLFKIRAKQLKPGGLRLFLMFYLMGMQNTPDRKTWRADQKLMSVNVSPRGYESDDDDNYDGDDDNSQVEEKKYVLEMLYDVDRTGMLQIELLPSSPRNPNRPAEIRIYRFGSRPSTSYLMQESVIIDGVLDELQNISGEKDLATTIPRSDNPNVGEDKQEDIADEDRLLITDPPNAIEAARKSLAFS